jgi:radical SAM protein with 4Fe4S-binding SPASM domain
MLSKETIAAYNKVRTTAHKQVICHAPFTSLNFEQNGNVTACCFNRKEVLGKYPAQTLKQIWESKAANNLRKKIATNNLEGGCKLCNILLQSGNYGGTKAIYYDEYAHNLSTLQGLAAAVGFPQAPYPKVFEFEISNTCNLECEMCSGYFSSSIRKNREQLPELPQPYDDNFVEQVAAFLPTLTDLKFLGGEPFLIDIYYKIWDKAVAINPAVRIHITTNGTMYNQRIEDLIKRLNANIIFSLDAVSKEKYEQIRKGARYERVMENFKRFKIIAEEKKTYLGITACVMTNNWMEIPDLVRFANAENVQVHFNIVWNPGHLSIRFMQHHEIEAVINFLKAQQLPGQTWHEKNNLNSYLEVISTLEYWLKERSFSRLVDDATQPFAFNAAALNALPKDALSQQLAFIVLAHFLQLKKLPDEMARVEEFFKTPAHSTADAGRQLLDLWRGTGDNIFAATLLNLYVPLYQLLIDSNTTAFAAQMDKVIPLLLNFKNLQAVISDTVEGISRQGILQQLLLIKNNPVEVLEQHLNDSY